MKRLFTRATVAASLGLMLLNTGCTPESLTMVNNLLTERQQVSAGRTPAKAASDLPTAVQSEASDPASYQPPRREGAPRYEAPLKPSAEPTAMPTPCDTPEPIRPSAEPMDPPSAEPTAQPTAEPTPYPEPSAYPVAQEPAALCAREMLKIRFVQPADAPRRDWYGAVSVEQGHVYLMRQLQFIPENMAYGNPPEFSVVKWKLSPADNYAGLMMMIDGQPAKAMPQITLRLGNQSKTLDFKQLALLNARIPFGEAGHAFEISGALLPAGTCGPLAPDQEKSVYSPSQPGDDSQTLSKGGVSDDGI